LANEWRRYLAQQVELGGAEVFLDRRDGPAVTAEGERAEGTGREAGAPALDAQASRPVPGDSPASGQQPTDAADRHAPAALSSAPPSRDDDSSAGAAPPGASPVTADPPDPAGEAAGTRKWMKGAPPIPGPGMTILSPSPILLGNDLGALDSLEAVAERIRTTYCCDLCPHRTKAVPGEGNPQARLVLVGEGPGANEDATGRPFVGAAGQLLDTILEAIEVPRSSVYITNIVKCRPPQNRKPLPDEIAACIPYLHRQLDLIAPKVIMALGGTAGEALLGVRKSLGELRNKVHTYNGIPLVVTYHPAALLRNPNWKKPTWDDVRIARQLLDR
jgi:DNA polymerase